MNDINFKAFVIPFYRSLLGFWILVLVFGCVFMELRQHVLLGQFLFTHPVAFSLLPIGFLAYTGFHLRFQQTILRSREYRIFHQTALLPLQIFRKNWDTVFLSNHAIILAYLAFLSYFGLIQNAWILLGILWLTVGLSCGVSIRLLHRHLRHPLREAVLARPKWRQNLPPATWFALELRQNRPILLLLTKGLSLLLLNGFFGSFQSGTYDQRWLEFGVLCVSFLQIPLLMEKNDFENHRMAWFRSLPTRLSRKMLTHFETWALVLFPELLFLLWKGIGHARSEVVFALPLVLMGYTLVLQAMCYRFPGKAFFNLAFGLFFGCFLLILFAIPWILPFAAFFLFFALQIRSPFQL